MLAPTTANQTQAPSFAPHHTGEEPSKIRSSAAVVQDDPNFSREGSRVSGGGGGEEGGLGAVWGGGCAQRKLCCGDSSCLVSPRLMFGGVPGAPPGIGGHLGGGDDVTAGCWG